MVTQNDVTVVGAHRIMSSTRLRTLARGLSPGFLRFGGTKGDFLIFDPEVPATLEEKILQDSLVQQDACEMSSEPLDVIERLRSQWPIQEMLILRELRENNYENTTITRSTLDILHNFAKCAQLELIFGLNALLRKGDQWDSTNAQLILNYTESQNYQMSWELGNEPNSFFKKSGLHINGYQLGQDFIQLRQLLNNYQLYRNASLYGPDVGQPRKQTQKLLQSFLESGGKVIDSVTWHHYYMDGRKATKEDFLSPQVLDTFITVAQEELQLVGETLPGKRVWLGETSSAYGGGTPRLSNTYIAGFMWLDKLGLSAQLGIDVVMRQVLFGAGSYQLVDPNFDPLPDYWLSLLYKKLVGTKVLSVNVTGEDPKKLRVYLHCTNEHQGPGFGSPVDLIKQAYQNTSKGNPDHEDMQKTRLPLSGYWGTPFCVAPKHVIEMGSPAAPGLGTFSPSSLELSSKACMSFGADVVLSQDQHHPPDGAVLDYAMLSSRPVGLAGPDPLARNKAHPMYREGDITLFALNLYNSTKVLQLPALFSKKQIDEYLLLPQEKNNMRSQLVQLNGQVLKMLDDKTLPTLQGKPLSPGSSLELPAFSYGFYVIKYAKVIACI